MDFFWIKGVEKIMNNFREEVLDGLGKFPKTLPSKYFYDEIGDKLFQEIMNLEEYYLPRLELEIIENKSLEIANSIITDSSKLDIIELGAGDGSKTKYLLKSFLSKFEINYIPLDISQNILNENRNILTNFIPELKVNGIAGNYLHTFPEISQSPNKKLVLFMGSNIGNFYFSEAIEFVKFISNHLKNNDYILIAFDLKKHPQMILDAYNDKSGVTSKFNLNLLNRINKELDGDFIIDNFLHYPTYDPVTGNTYSYLISQENQSVKIDKRNFHFNKYDTIQTEISKKYSIDDIENLAIASKLKIANYFFDINQYYSLVLFQK